LSKVSKISASSARRALSTTCISKSQERFGNPDGESGWKWEKGGVGMGGKEADAFGIRN